MPPSFFPPPSPSEKREMHPFWICRSKVHGHFSSSGGSNMIRLRNVSAFPLNPAHPKPRHSTAVSLSSRGKGPGQASTSAAQCQSSRSSEGGGGKKVCVFVKRKRGGGRLHSKWHLMLVSPQCGLINHAGLNFTNLLQSWMCGVGEPLWIVFKLSGPISSKWATYNTSRIWCVSLISLPPSSFVCLIRSF